MNRLALQQVADYCQGQLINGTDMTIDNAVIDSRQAGKSSLFAAFSGEHVDGHDYVASLHDKNAAALVERVVDAKTPQIKVANTEKALGELAKQYRKQLTLPMLAMTGSCGKTSTKEMLLAILSLKGSVCATKGNQNNEIGVPLTVLNIDDSNDYAIVEMGAAEQGDIEYLMNIAQPDVVALTNVSTAHIGRFGSEQGIAKAKSEIYESLKKSGVALVNIDEKYSDDWLAILHADNIEKIVCYSINNKAADIYASDIQLLNNAVKFTAHIHGEAMPIVLNTLGQHQVSNALCAIAAAMSVGVEPNIIAQGLASFTVVDGRMAVYEHSAGGVLIDDSYNANTGSVKAAVDVLANYKTRRILVLGDMAELGSYSQALHTEVGEYAKAQGIDVLLSVGIDSQYSSNAFGAVARHFSDKESLAAYLQNDLQADDVILIKGSRSAGLETLVELLKKEGTH